jgi:hypothetical protein
MTILGRKLSIKHLLLLCYIFVLSFLVVLLVREQQEDRPPFSLSRASAETSQGVRSVTLHGVAFNSDIRGVLARVLVNEEALAWHQMADLAIRGVDVKDDLALVSCYRNKLVSIGLRGGTDPELLGSVDLPGVINKIRIVGDQAVVGMHRINGLALVDVKDPRAMKVLRSYPLAGSLLSIAVDGSSVYYADLYQGIGRIDLSAGNPASEALVSLDSPLQITLIGKKLVAGAAHGMVHLFNVASGGQLAEVARLDFPADVRGVALTAETLTVALSDRTLQIFRLSTWPKLVTSAKLDLPGKPLAMESVPGREKLVVGLVSGGAVVIDLSRPEEPVLGGHLKLPRTFWSMSLHPERLFATSRFGVEMFSLDAIETGESALLASKATVDLHSYALQSWQGHVYGYDDSNKALVDFGEKSKTEVKTPGRLLPVVEDDGVSLYEQRLDGAVQRVGARITMTGVGGARFQDNHLYVTHKGGLRIFSGGGSEDLVAISDLILPGFPGVMEFIDDDHLLVTTRDEDLLVIKVDDPQAPVQVASLSPYDYQDVANFAREILVDGDVAYVSHGDGGVQIIDLSTPEKPELQQVIETPGSVRSMALHDGLLLAADGLEGVFMVDVKDRKNALIVGSLPTPIRVDQIAVTDDGLIVSSDSGGTMKLPLPQRLQGLQLISEGEMRVGVDKVEKGQYVYLYDAGSAESVKVSLQ